MKHIEKDQIIVTANVGTTKAECIDEAIILAMSDNVSVILIYHAIQYEIQPADVRSSVIKLVS